MPDCPWCRHALPHGATLVFQGEVPPLFEVAEIVAVDRKAGTYSVDARDFCTACDDPCIPPIGVLCAPCTRQRHGECRPDEVMFQPKGAARCRCTARGCPESVLLMGEMGNG